MRTKQNPRAVFTEKKPSMEDAYKVIERNPDIMDVDRENIMRFLKHLRMEDRGMKTIRGYANSLQFVAKYYAGRSFLRLEREDVKEILFAMKQDNYAKSTLSSTRIRFRRFIRWLREEYGYPDDYPDDDWAGKKLKPGDQPAEFRGMKMSSKYEVGYNPEDLPIQEDVNRMIEVADGARDRAIVSVLYESAARSGEFLGLTVGAVERTPYGWRLHVNGKTGRRPILLVNSGPYLAAWLQFHPFREDRSAPLFVSCGTRRNARKYFERTGDLPALDKGSLRAVLEKLAERAKVKKKVNPHAFRHARATELSKHLKESQLRAYMGWSPGSPMPGIYVHLSGRDTEMAILAANGIEIPEEARQLSATQICPACDDRNPNGAKLCLRCTQPLTVGAGIKVDEAFREMGRWLPLIKENEKAMRDFGRLLRKHNLLEHQASIAESHSHS